MGIAKSHHRPLGARPFPRRKESPTPGRQRFLAAQVRFGARCVSDNLTHSPSMRIACKRSCARYIYDPTGRYVACRRACMASGGIPTSRATSRHRRDAFVRGAARLPVVPSGPNSRTLRFGAGMWRCLSRLRILPRRERPRQGPAPWAAATPGPPRRSPFLVTVIDSVDKKYRRRHRLPAIRRIRAGGAASPT